MEAKLLKCYRKNIEKDLHQLFLYVFVLFCVRFFWLAPG